MRTYLGIDPGASGGMAVLIDSELCTYRMPKTEADVVDLLCTLAAVADGIVMERIGGYVGKEQPGSYMFNFGRGCGIIAGCLLALGRRFDEVEPQRWQAALGLRRSRGMGKSDWKRALKAEAQRSFPSAKITLATCDAVLLARYARLSHEGAADGGVMELTTEHILFGGGDDAEAD